MEQKMTFSDALIQIREGKTVARSGWNGKDQWLQIEKPVGKITTNVILFRTTNADYVPWCPSQTDLLADDWHTVPGAGNA